jgi:hypothetical protein
MTMTTLTILSKVFIFFLNFNETTLERAAAGAEETKVAAATQKKLLKQGETGYVNQEISRLDNTSRWRVSHLPRFILSLGKTFF